MLTFFSQFHWTAHVFIVGLAIAATCSLLSPYIVLRRMALISEGVSHAGFGGIGAQLLIQAKAVGVTVIWTAVSAFIAFKIADLIVGLRVPEDQEREGLDTTSHGEMAYHD